MTSLSAKYIDSHAHLDFYTPQERAAVLARMQAAQVQAITIGTQAKDFPLLRQMAQEHPQQVAYTVGLHPSEVTPENWRTEVAAVEAALADGSPVGLGEMGLDYYRLPPVGARDVVQAQQQAFAAQLSILRSCGLPAVIHSRGDGAYADIIKMMDAARVDWSRVVFHCYSEGALEVRELNARGGRASFTGIITFKNGQKMREALVAQGPDRLMVETDSPFLSPEPHRGSQNEPSRVPLVAVRAAELLGMPIGQAAQIFFNTTVDFFGLPWAY